MDSSWIEHRRGRDGERLGWIRMQDDGFVAIDLLGRERTAIVDWETAESTLDELGIGYLAELYELELEDGRWLRARIAEVTPGSITVKQDDGGAVGAPQVYYPLPFPAPSTLRLLRR
ncbi:hypothetical protein BHE97_11390 [Aeromicrobium sp. PE09-221]|uniref:hypothetical protein n=1 Tax=Aeromicrobium sp. PE09-221 TaxID=1898043 RepID=UPI000B3E9249|nr:hypothetical protein [Aeromicrobium sp. PE09-221]OUZ09101.1 hypothetical protein BHE97_11390 [Aeromicrobium sp. PE09-221]